MTTAYATQAWRALTAEAKRTYPATCHLCTVAIDMDLPHTDRHSWTLDHLDPVHQYGTAVPSLDRVRPAHRGCNSRRGAKAKPASPRSEAW